MFAFCNTYIYHPTIYKTINIHSTCLHAPSSSLPFLNSLSVIKLRIRKTVHHVPRRIINIPLDGRVKISTRVPPREKGEPRHLFTSRHILFQSHRLSHRVYIHTYTHIYIYMEKSVRSIGRQKSEVSKSVVSDSVELFSAREKGSTNRPFLPPGWRQRVKPPVWPTINPALPG